MFTKRPFTINLTTPGPTGANTTNKSLHNMYAFSLRTKRSPLIRDYHSKASGKVRSFLLSSYYETYKFPFAIIPEFFSFAATRQVHR